MCPSCKGDAARVSLSRMSLSRMSLSRVSLSRVSLSRISVPPARARTVGELLAPTSPFDKKCGRENWTVAFAPDGSYLAWSQGHRIVKLVPWAQCLNNL